MNIDIFITHTEPCIWDLKKNILNTEFISKLVKNILNRHNNIDKLNKVELSILLTDNQNMQELNHRFRSKNKPTDVLSFPQHELHFNEIETFIENKEYIMLGDIAFGHESIIQYSKDYNVKFDDRFMHLLVHSILHLLGYNHILECEAKIMEKLEIEILKDFGITLIY